MGLMDSLRTGASGLGAASAAIDATAQNVSNVSTPGYTRRSVDQSVTDPIRRGLVQVGQGVTVSAITRDNDGLLGVQRIDAAGTASRSSSHHGALNRVELLFDETQSDGVRSHLDAFFDSLVAATADPADEGLRGAVLAEAEDLAAAVARTADDLAAAQTQFADEADAVIPTLNTLLSEVAALNDQLIAAGGASSAPDIADQIDRRLIDLGSEAGFTAHLEADGTATVLLGGHAVVTRGEARHIGGDIDGLTVQVDRGAVRVKPGGRLGGLADAKQAITDYEGQLDAFAVAFTDSVNATLSNGFTLRGFPGVPVFAFDAIDPAGSLTTDPSLQSADLAFAGALPAHAGDADNLAALLDLESQALVGDQTLGQALSTLTNAVATDVATIASVADRDAVIRNDLDALNQTLHGVDLDEEATNLITFQTAYQAAAKMIQVTDELLSTLMDIT